MKDAKKHFNNAGWINSIEKIKNTFLKDTCIDEVIYCDFYALPKYGKTKLGNLLIYAKQAQNKNLIKKIANDISQIINEVIKT